MANQRNPKLESVVFDGVYYSRRNGARYYTARRWDSKLRRYWDDSLHRAVWRFHHGTIPNGFDVHHSDEDWNNNDISNLECITRAEHNRRHGAFAAWNKTKRAAVLRKRNNWKAWQNMPYRSVVCQQCQKKFASRHPDPKRPKFCSALCGERYRHSRLRSRSRGCP